MDRNILIGAFAILIVGGGIYLVQANKPTDTTTTTNQSPIITPGENPEPGSPGYNLPVEPAAAAARKDLATKLSVAEGSIVILQITDTTWNDGCLGLGGPAESCLQALVPGFEVEMLTNGTTYTYRTDKTGAVLRAETD